MVSDDEITGCQLPGGRRASATVSRGQILITVSGPEDESASVRLRYPRYGLGGGRLLGSPSGRYLVFSHYSGQSEESYRVFDIGEGIRRTKILEYHGGESAGFAFSADERLLVSAIPLYCVNWWELMESDRDSLPLDDDERPYFEFGVVVTHDLEKESRAVTEIRVRADEDWSAHREEYEPELDPVLTSDAKLRLSMPWGPVELAMPLPTAVNLQPPV